MDAAAKIDFRLESSYGHVSLLRGIRVTTLIFLTSVKFELISCFTIIGTDVQRILLKKARLPIENQGLGGLGAILTVNLKR